MRISVLILIGITVLYSEFNLASGIQVGRTRVIYDANKKEVALPLTNKETELPWLIQSWTDTGDGKTRGPFIITPPLFRLDPQKEQSLRITWSGQALPQDRESLFYLNIRTIPAQAKEQENQNVLRLIYKTRLKLFWRPSGLQGSPIEACKNLHFNRHADQLLITNNGAFYSVFDSLRLGGKALPQADMVAPQQTAQFNLPAGVSGQQVSWHCISDYGSATEKFTASLT